MKKIFLILFILLIPLAYAGLISSPPPLPENSPSLQHYLYDIFANLHVLEVRTAVSTRTPSEGQMEAITDDSSIYDFYIYLNDDWRKWSSNEFDITFDGDITFSSGAGLVYGEVYAMGAGEDVQIAASGEGNKTQITAFDTNGESNLMTPNHTQDHLTIDVAGIYLCTVSIHIDSQTGSAATFGFAAYKNNGDTQFPNIHGHRDLPAGAGGNAGAVSMTGILNLTVNDTIEVWAWNEDNTQDVTVDDITLSLIMTGG